VPSGAERFVRAAVSAKVRAPSLMRTRYAPGAADASSASRALRASFGTFHYSYPLFGGRIRAFMPPQGLL